MVERLDFSKFREAAVLVPIVFQDDVPHLLFTERSHFVEHHKGQICFPGGARDTSDTNLYHTALRETEEEIGLSAEHIIPVGRLPIEVTPSLYKIQPFIAVIKPFALNDLSCASDEISSVFLVPLVHFANPSTLTIQQKDFFGHTIQIPHFQHLERNIWGATGRMVINLLKAMHLSEQHHGLDVKPVFTDSQF